MTFRMTDRVEVQRDDDVVRRLRHPRQPYGSEDASALTGLAADAPMSTRELADAYLREVMPLYEMDEAMVADLDASFAAAPERAAPSSLVYLDSHDMPNQAAVDYAQTHVGLPVWQAGFQVKLAGSPPRVVGSQSSMVLAIDLVPPSADAAYDEVRLDPPTLARLLGLGSADGLEINATRKLIYRLDRQFRGTGAGEPAEEPAADASMMHVPAPTLPLPPLPDDLEDGRHYVVVEVLFSYTRDDWGELHWGAFIEPRTGAVLRLDSFVGCLHHGHVYLQDPPTRSGSEVRPTSRASRLDALRERVALEGLTPPASAAAEQDLRGEYVRLVDIQLPHVAPPTRPVGRDFEYSVPTDDFAGVNAYFHCDRLFRLVEGMGLDVRNYFDGTTFPVRVDHRFSYRLGGVLTGNVINASAPGNATRNGSDGFRFALLESGTNVGIALHWRVVLHEFGHTILWDHVDSPNFRFAHSPGDSLAAILNDPGSRGPDRFLTFPFTPISRRHDRRPQDGWAWGGAQDDPFPIGHPQSGDPAGYDREQILSSTLFRLYRALGGDHTDPAEQQRAARYTTFLIFSAVGMLSPVAQPSHAEDFAEALMDADLAVTEFEGWAGGAGHKVARWAFEQQGAYQPPGAPANVRSEGAPPRVDIYIDDGRRGGYAPSPSFQFSTDDLWNRRVADGGTEHQEPAADRTNFLYARVRNRGSDAAEGVRVETFTTRDGSERLWPSAWTATVTPSAEAVADLASGGEEVLGPLAWEPGAEGGIAVLVVAESAADPSNRGTVQAPIAVARFAHTDNNVAGRMMRVQAVPAGGGDDETTGTHVQAVAQPRLPIPDADPAGVVSRLHVSTEGAIRRLGVSVTINHTYIGDLRVTLDSPAGTEAVLFEGRGLGQSQADLALVLTSDDDETLKVFEGETAQGAWSLRVVDRIGIDLGTLERWSLGLVLG